MINSDLITALYIVNKHSMEMKTIVSDDKQDYTASFGQCLQRSKHCFAVFDNSED